MIDDYQEETIEHNGKKNKRILKWMCVAMDVCFTWTRKANYTKIRTHTCPDQFQGISIDIPGRIIGHRTLSNIECISILKSTVWVDKHGGIYQGRSEEKTTKDIRKYLMKLIIK